MSRKSKRIVTAEEQALFEAVVKNVRRRQQGIAPPPINAAPPAEQQSGRKKKHTNPAHPRQSQQERPPLPPARKSKKPGLWRDEGLDRRTSEKLRKGQMTIEARLDLHGLRQHNAHQQLVSFIRHAYQSGQRCVLVITGKGSDGVDGGRGVLNMNLPRWLSEADLKPMILSLRPARPKDGGDGAYYVLLRRQRER